MQTGVLVKKAMALWVDLGTRVRRVTYTNAEDSAGSALWAMEQGTFVRTHPR